MGGVGIVTLALLAVAALYFLLRSSWVESRLVPWLDEALRPHGVALQVASARVDLLHGAWLEDLHLQWRDEALGEMQLHLHKLDLSFNPWALLDGELHLSRLALTGLRADGRLKHLPAASGSEAVDQEAAGLDLKEIEALLRHPPFSVRIDRVALEDARLDLHFQADEQRIRYRTALGYEGGLLWRPGHLRLRSRAELGGEENRLTLDLPGERPLRASARSALQADLEVQLTEEGDGWRLVLEPLGLDLTAADVLLTGAGAEDEGQRLTLDSLNVVLSAHSRGAERQGELAGLFPLPVEVAASVALGGLRGEIAGAEQFRMEAEQRTDVALRARIDPFAQRVEAFELSAEQQLSLPSLHLAGSGQSFSLETSEITAKLQAQSQPGSYPRQLPPFTFTAELGAGAQGVTTVRQEARAPRTTLQLAPRYHLKLDGALASLEQWRSALSARLEQQLVIAGLELEQHGPGAPERVRVAEQTLELKGHLEAGRAELNGDWRLAGVEVPGGKRPLDMQHAMRLRTGLELTDPQLSLALGLDGLKLLDLELSGQDNAGAFALDQRLALDLPQRLAAYHSAAAVLELLGDQRVTVAGEATVAHGAERLAQAQVDTAPEWAVEGHWRAEVVQGAAPRRADGLRLQGPARIELGFEKGERYAVDVALNAGGLHVAPLRQSLPLAARLQGRFDGELRAVDARGEVHLAGEEALRFRLGLVNDPGRAVLNSHWALRGEPAWQRYLAELAPLDAVGSVALDTAVQATLLHPAESVVAVDPVAMQDRLRLDATLNGSLAQRAAGEGALATLTEPLGFKQRLRWSATEARLEGDLQLPAATLMDKLRLGGVQTGLSLSAHSGIQPRVLAAKVKLASESIVALHDGVPMELVHLVAPADLSLAMELDEGTVRIDEFQLLTGDRLLELGLMGDAATDGRTAQLTGTLAFRPRDGLMSEPRVAGRGLLQLPWRFTMANGGQVSLDGGMHFSDFGITVDQFALDGLEGSLRLQEELELTPEGTVRFGYLVRPDAFQRVDFERIHPYLDERYTLSAQAIRFGERQVGPMLADIPVRQNLLRLQRFDLALFGGHLAGQFYLDVTPGAWRVGLLSRVSNVDLRELLPPPSPGAADHAPVSARLAVEMDVRQRLLEGRIDLTDITRAQLLQLLEIMDPDHQDEQLARVRSALALAHPQWVAVEMNRGLMDLRVKLSLLAEPLAVRGLPLSPILDRFAGEALQNLERLPLERGKE